ncbi:MAG: hypothetical protein ABSB26_03930 [Nitrososphaerales archaeon]|jgi:hypothetical protein
MVKPAVPISFDSFTFSVEEIEGFLGGIPDNPAFQKPFSPKLYTLKSGEQIVIRPAAKTESPAILESLKPLIDSKYDKDFYHLVGTRTYAEILAWYQNRLKDTYVIVATRKDGELVGLADHRFWDKNVAISLHTLVLKRAERVGVILYLSKIEHAFDVVGVNEWWATFESPFGFRLGFRFNHVTKPWPEMQHELGGARIFYINRQQWEEYVKPFAKEKNWLGTRPVAKSILNATKPLKPTSKLEIEL